MEKAELKYFFSNMDSYCVAQYRDVEVGGDGRCHKSAKWAFLAYWQLGNDDVEWWPKMPAIFSHPMKLLYKTS
jgi:hypothetical protein